MGQVTAGGIDGTGRRVVSASLDGKIRVWDLAGANFGATPNPVATASHLLRGGTIGAPSGADILAALNASTLSPPGVVLERGHSAGVVSLCLNEGATAALSMGLDQAVHAWDLTDTAGHGCCSTRSYTWPDNVRPLSLSADAGLGSVAMLCRSSMQSDHMWVW